MKFIVKEAVGGSIYYWTSFDDFSRDRSDARHFTRGELKGFPTREYIRKHCVLLQLNKMEVTNEKA